MDPAALLAQYGLPGLAILALIVDRRDLTRRLDDLAKQVAQVQEARLADSKDQSRQLYEATATLRAAMDLVKSGRP